MAIAIFRKIKAYTLKGNLTSELGTIKVLRHDPLLSNFLGDIVYKKDNKVLSLNMQTIQNKAGANIVSALAN